MVAGRRRGAVSNQSVSVALTGVLSRLPGAPQLPEAAPAAQRHPHHPAQLFRLPQAAQLAVVEALHQGTVRQSVLFPSLNKSNISTRF